MADFAVKGRLLIRVNIHRWFCPQIVWFKSPNTRLSTTDKMYIKQRGSKLTLFIERIDPSFFGNYSCQANNKLGKSTAFVSLAGLASLAVSS